MFDMSWQHLFIAVAIVVMTFSGIALSDAWLADQRCPWNTLGKLAARHALTGLAGVCLWLHDLIDSSYPAPDAPIIAFFGVTAMAWIMLFAGMHELFQAIRTYERARQLDRLWRRTHAPRTVPKSDAPRSDLREIALKAVLSLIAAGIITHIINSLLENR